MNIAELIKHPERLNKETLYDLRSLVALYPYYQPARLLMLRNLYLLHDSSFDEELRRAAVYVTDRRVIFNLVEAAHYRLKRPAVKKKEENRTVSLIDNFLSSMPDSEDYNAKEKHEKRKPTALDATVDYVAYLVATDFEEESTSEDVVGSKAVQNQVGVTPAMKGQSLIDDFIANEGGKISLKDEPEYLPQLEDLNKDGEKVPEEEYFTETLAGIYIKQGRYLKALEIIKRLNLNYPKKNAYFADQIRFLEKLIANNEAEKRVKES